MAFSTLNSIPKMNALNKAMLDFMEEAGEYVFENGVGMVIGNQARGMPGAFSAGGDLAYMVGLAKEGKFEKLIPLLKAFIAASWD